MLSCKNKIRGHKKHRCPHCHYTVTVPHTCKSRFCSSCGKMATEKWIENNYEVLPKTNYQHVTFTMPDVFWDFFWSNRHLLRLIPAIAASVLQDLAKKKKLIVGIFLMLHTFGRDLKRNVHIHLSVTLGGLTLDLKQWKNTSFKYDAMMKMWRTRIIQMLRSEFLNGNLTLPPQFKHLNTYSQFNKMLDDNYQKKWNVHASKADSDHKKNINYFARYLKRPPLADTRIEKYDSEYVTFNFFDHHEKKHTRKTLTVHEFIAHVIQHIPDKHFKLIRYYGIFANRIRGTMLPIVRRMLNLKEPKTKNNTSYQSMIINEFHVDPLQCPFCKVPMYCACVIFGESTSTILQNHKKLALPIGTPM